MDTDNTLLRMLGQGVVRDAGNDLALREEYLRLKEMEALGEGATMPDYQTWKRRRLAPQANGGMMPNAYYRN